MDFRDYHLLANHHDVCTGVSVVGDEDDVDSAEFDTVLDFGDSGSSSCSYHHSSPPLSIPLKQLRS